MDDLISRQAAIDAIEKAMCEDGFRSSTGLIHKTTAYEVIRHLPSAQPEIRTQMSSANCISRQAVLKLLAAMPPEEAITKAMLIQSVKQMDAAQPYTDEEIQKMQDIEQAQLEKAYEIGKADALKWIPCSERLPEPYKGDANG